MQGIAVFTQNVQYLSTIPAALCIFIFNLGSNN